MKTAFPALIFAGLCAAAGAAEPATLTNSIGMEFVRIPAGTFTYGRFAPPSPAAPRAPAASTSTSRWRWPG